MSPFLSLRVISLTIASAVLAPVTAQDTPAAPPAAPAVVPVAAPVLPPVDLTALPAVDAAALKSRVQTLSSDAMEGRATGSPGGLAAAKYLAAQLAAAGLQPAGDDGSFLQTIDRAGFALDGAPELSWTTSEGATVQATWGADFDYADGPPMERELAVVIATADKDPPLPPRADAALLLLGPRRSMRGWLKAGGAEDGVGWGALLGLGQPSKGAPSTGATGLYRKGAAASPLRLVARGKLREALEARQVAKLKVAVRGKDETPAVNVVGRLPGAGLPDRPELAQQAVVFSAHYDHLGTRAAPVPDPKAPAPDAAPDLVFNGADDDASGCAAVLALADHFGAQAKAGQRPARTLIFLLATGEEHGLWGTQYYLDHPVVPLASTTANLNFEMIGRPDPMAGGSGRLWLTGFEHSNLGPEWARLGLPVMPDARPGEHFFERSDNYAFVERGVPGQTLSSYDMHTDYHTVEDEVERVDFAHMEVAVRASLAAARTLADGSLKLEWKPVTEEAAESKASESKPAPESKPAETRPAPK
jgi:hypothetical protein